MRSSKKKNARREAVLQTWQLDRAKKPRSLVRFFAESPLVGLQLNLERTQDVARDFQL